MDEVITENRYPVQGLWILKSIPGLILSLIIVGFLWFLFPFARSTMESQQLLLILAIFAYPIFDFIVTILRRVTFHYSIDERFLTLRQGILSKQERHIPYGVIQNIFVKQDLFDRILGLASLTIENASQGAGALAASQELTAFGFRIGGRQRPRVEMVGFSGNKVNIPGLKKINAEILREIILKKMKENPIEDSQSGL